MIRTKFLASLALLFVLLLSVSCGSGGSSMVGTFPNSGSLYAINITPATPTVSAVGKTVQLTATGQFSVAPFTANLGTKAVWTTSDSTIAIVNSTGLVTAQGAGTALVFATATGINRSQIAGQATVTVQ